MTRTLIASVGTGTRASDKAVESLAGSIAFSVNHFNPDKVCFVVSHESETRTLPKILEKIGQKHHEVFRISTPDNIQRIFHEIKPKIEALRKESDYLAVD